MAARKILIGDLEADAVYAAYRVERAVVRRSHLQVIWLLLSGSTVSEVSSVTGLCERWIKKLMDRWNAQGLEGLGDRRQGNAGAEPLLDAVGLGALASALEAEPEDGGLWSGRKVAAWMSAYLGREVSPKRGLDYLHRLNYSRQQPRPRHAKAASPEEQEGFKKKSPRQWRRLVEKPPVTSAPGTSAQDRPPVAGSKSGLSTSIASG